MRGLSTRASGPERLWAFSDGVYAIAITLLVLNIDMHPDLNDAEFLDALRRTVPQILAYALSFVVIAAFWRDQRRILAGVRHADDIMTRTTLLGLGLVALMPFPTALLSEYGHRPQAVAIYSGTIAAVAAVHSALVLYQRRHPALLAEPMTTDDYRFSLLDLGTTVLVMLVSVGIALVLGSATVAKWIWVVLLPAKQILTLMQKRQLARHEQTPNSSTEQAATEE
ncbi:TMEM175 family protein [Nocardia arthritidis]|uniref:TMEM175 family protein n=1 Tax=Nocardia arthritidis TaxID=228602 RepID=UPI00142D8083|nr:TMEM175 family protein [Nocardia arthritidis]